MTPPRSVEEWAKRHEKVEDVIFDGPVCRTCRLIDGTAVPYPCDAASILVYATEQVARARADTNADVRNHLYQILVNRLSCDLAGLEQVPSDAAFEAMLDQMVYGARAEEREVTMDSWTVWVNDFFDTKLGSDPGVDVIKGIILDKIAAIRARRDEG